MYWASPLPKDQFSRATSTRLTTRSCAFSPGMPPESRPCAGKFAFLLGLASGAHRDLHEDDFVGALDAQVRALVNQALGRMLRNHLEAVVRWERERFDHGALHAVTKSLAIVRGSSLAKIDSYQWHRGSSSFVSVPEKGGALRRVAANGGAKHLWWRTASEGGPYKKHLREAGVSLHGVCGLTGCPSHRRQRICRFR
jgi:hypothetical protein